MITINECDKTFKEQVEQQLDVDIMILKFQVLGLHNITSEKVRHETSLQFYDAVASTAKYRIMYTFCPTSGWYRRETHLKNSKGQWVKQACYLLNKRKTTQVQWSESLTGNPRFYSKREFIRERDLVAQMTNSLLLAMKYRQALANDKTSNFSRYINSDPSGNRLVQNLDNRIIRTYGSN